MDNLAYPTPSSPKIYLKQEVSVLSRMKWNKIAVDGFTEICCLSIIRYK